MSTKPVAVVFGAGANVGAAVVSKFASNGYRVAAVSRSQTPSISADHLAISADLTKPAQVVETLAFIQKTWSAFPSVIVWNAARRALPKDETNIFSVPLEELELDLAVNVTSPWAAAGEAIKNWEQSQKQSTFIYTGNRLGTNTVPVPAFASLGTAKRASTYWLEAADQIYKPKGWRFFFADERTADGHSVGSKPGAESHADFYYHLSQGAEDLPTISTFTSGAYKEF